jgi:predicted dehydrogenase
MTKLGIGLIGCGDIGHLRAQAILKNENLRFVSVADADASRAAAFAAKYNTTADKDWTAMLGRKDLDAVIVSTPPSSHAELAIAAVQAGKHVLVEKPLARTPEECRAMIAAAETCRRVLATGFNYRFYPSVMKAREFFDSGAIGELDHIRSYTGYSATAHNHGWLHDAGVMGGGTLRDNGIHLIDTTCYFFGDPVDIQGLATSRVWKFPGCEDNGFALIRNATGNIASIQASWTEWSGYKFSIDIYGDKGCIRLRCFPMVTNVFSGGVDQVKRSRQSFYFPKVHFMEHLKSYRWIVVESFVREFDEFRAAIDGRKTAIASGHDGWRAVEIAHRACLQLN